MRSYRTKFGLRVRANLSLTLVVVNQAINLLPHWPNWSATYSVVNYFNDSTKRLCYTDNLPKCVSDNDKKVAERQWELIGKQAK